MKLIYTESGEEVKIEDRAQLSDGQWVEVVYFRSPYRPHQIGKVTVKYVDDPSRTMEYYVSVIGAEWINREDR